MRLRSIVLLLAIIALSACGGETTSPAGTLDENELPADQIVYGLRHVMTTEGVRKAVLLSDTAYLREDGRRFDLQGVDLDFYDESGVPAGELTSETGEYQMTTGEFTARGNVVLITEGANGVRRLETEELHYSPDADQIWSDEPFVLREGGEVSRGLSFQSDTQFENFTIQGAEGQIPGSEITF